MTSHLGAGQALRMSFRAALLEEAVEQGMTHRDAAALIERLHTAGIFGREAETLESQLDSVVRVALRNHAHAVVMLERSKAAPAQPAQVQAADVNAPLVLTAMN